MYHAMNDTMQVLLLGSVNLLVTRESIMSRTQPQTTTRLLHLFLLHGHHLDPPWLLASLS